MLDDSQRGGELSMIALSACILPAGPLQSLHELRTGHVAAPQPAKRQQQQHLA